MNISPACAGVIPGKAASVAPGILFPAHAGVIPAMTSTMSLPRTFPRTCGGDPVVAEIVEAEVSFSPRIRG